MSITINGTTGISGVDGSAGTPALQGSDPNTGIYSPGENQVAVATNGVGRLFVDASGGVGVGTASPVTQFHIQKATGGLAGVQISTSTHGSTITDGLFVGIDNSLGYLYQYENLPLVFGTNATERLRITSDAYVRLASGSGGIQFNGDTAAANALDDYEEGTWTPTIIGSTTPGTATYLVQTGSYLKIGVTVTVTFFVQWNTGTGLGSFTVGGLPFNTANDLSRITTGSIMMDGVPFSGNYVVPYSQYGTNAFILYATTAGTTWASVPYDSSGSIIGQLTYWTN
jgi:hypothetical protein